MYSSLVDFSFCFFKNCLLQQTSEKKKNNEDFKIYILFCCQLQILSIKNERKSLILERGYHPGSNTPSPTLLLLIDLDVITKIAKPRGFTLRAKEC